MNPAELHDSSRARRKIRQIYPLRLDSNEKCLYNMIQDKSSVNPVGAGILPSGLSRREKGFWLRGVVVLNDRPAGTSPTVALNVVH